MAEKYGTVPPRFTKKWWEYFWDYYKWRVIITITAILIAAITIAQCATRPKYDMNAVYCGHMNYSEEEIQKVQEILSENVRDIDGDGSQAVLFQQLVFSGMAGSEEYDYAVLTKLDMTFIDDTSFVYLFDEAEAQNQIQRESVSEIFEAADDWANGAEGITGSDGKVYAVSLEDSQILKENDIYCEDLYIMIRKNYKNDEENVKAHEDSINVAKVLVK